MTKPYPFILKNNDVIQATNVGVSLEHAGFCYGYGLFETVLVLNQTPILLTEHISRLKNSAQFLGLDLTGLPNDIGAKINTLIKRNNCIDARLNIYYVAGPREEGASLFSFSEADLFVVCRPFKPNLVAKPINVGLHESQFDRTILDSHKTLNYIKPILDRCERPNLDELIIVDKSGVVLEATMANVCLVKDNILVTPEDERVLPGVMRDYICKIASNLGLEVQKRSVMAEELKTCDEMFLTNSLKGILPVRCIDNGPSYALDISFKFQKIINEKLSLTFKSSS